MSFHAITWAADQTPKNATDKLVLLALANFCNKKDGNVCFPGQDTIAKFACCSVDTVQRSVKRLDTGGYIKIEKAVESNGQRTYDRYRLMFSVTTTTPDGRKITHAADCGVEDAELPSHAETDGSEQQNEAGKDQAADCGVDGESHAANHTANHAANQAADCGPNLREPKNPESLSPLPPASGGHEGGSLNFRIGLKPSMPTAGTATSSSI